MEDSTQNSNFFKDILIPSIVILLVISAGIGTGWFLNKNAYGSKNTTSSDVKVDTQAKEVGVKDVKDFTDEAEGTLEDGGLNGEGSHKLIRPGGASQTAALTSSVLDLDEFVGKKVHIWGRTMASQKAGWFMDVGKIKILE